MSYESDFLDFCLSCDRHTVDGPYCSHACRMADIEKSGSSSPYSTSPTDSFFAYSSASSSYSSGFHLPPAFNFSNATKKDSRPQSSSRSRDVVSRSSSVSSTSSSSASSHTGSASCMSESARQELRHYESLFDQTRYRPSSSR